VVRFTWDDGHGSGRWTTREQAEAAATQIAAAAHRCSPSPQDWLPWRSRSCAAGR
jgi:hypothetical protein